MAIRHCENCGKPYPEDAASGQHLECAACGSLRWQNPVPVNVVLVPICLPFGSIALLGGRRAKQGDRGYGKVGLTAGYLDLGEEVRVGAVRELTEEQQIPNTLVRPEELVLFDVRSSSIRHQVVIAWLAPTIDEQDLPPFEPSEEVSERVMIQPGQELAFSLHTQWAGRFFASQGLTT